MKTIEKILSEHLSRYPLMQPQDAVKLLFQSEFGPGHMIKDKETCLKRLTEEYCGVRHDSDMPLTEEIGGDFIRVNLAALDTKAISLENLSEAFIRSANNHSGDIKAFHEKLDQLKTLHKELPFSFAYPELAKYLNQYIIAGCPVVSHSETYRQAYHPAYRVIKASEFFANEKEK